MRNGIGFGGEMQAIPELSTKGRFLKSEVVGWMNHMVNGSDGQRTDCSLGRHKFVKRENRSQRDGISQI